MLLKSILFYLSIFLHSASNVRVFTLHVVYLRGKDIRPRLLIDIVSKIIVNQAAPILHLFFYLSARWRRAWDELTLERPKVLHAPISPLCAECRIFSVRSITRIVIGLHVAPLCGYEPRSITSAGIRVPDKEPVTSGEMVYTQSAYPPYLVQHSVTSTTKIVRSRLAQFVRKSFLENIRRKDC